MTYLNNLSAEPNWWQNLITEIVGTAPDIINAIKPSKPGQPIPGQPAPAPAPAPSQPNITVNVPSGSSGSSQSKGLPTWAIVAMVAGGIILVGGIGLIAFRKTNQSPSLPH